MNSLKLYVKATMEHLRADRVVDANWDRSITLPVDEESHDRLSGSRGRDFIEAGAGNDFISTGRGDDEAHGGTGNDIARLGRGDDIAYGGSGNDFLMGGRGNDQLFGGEGNDYFGAVNGSNLIWTGSGADTIVLTYRQTKMEAREGNEAGGAEWADPEDAYTIVKDFTLGEDRLHITGLKNSSKLEFSVNEEGEGYTDVLGAKGNIIVRLEGVTDVEAVAGSIDLGRFSWRETQLQLLQEGDAPGGLTKSGAVKGVDFKDKHSDYAVFDFGELGNQDGFSFFHGSDGSLDSEAKAAIRGSKLSEKNIDDFFEYLHGEASSSLHVKSYDQSSLILEVDNGRALDVIVFQGEVVEQALADHFFDLG